ncbi:hypothetical protein JCM8547_001020 [Rhodosporidiobolus lusitaniae]
MEYLDHSLSGSLAYLDPNAALHPVPDPAANHGLEAAALWDTWFDPAAGQMYDAQSILSVSQTGGGGAPSMLDTRGGLTSAGVYGSSSAGAAGSLAGLTGSVSTAVGSHGAMQLGYGPGDFQSEYLDSSATVPASGTAPRSALIQPVYTSSTPSSLSSSLSSSMAGTDPSTFSIAAYGNDTSASVSRRTSVANTPLEQSPRLSTRASTRSLQAPANGIRRTPKTPQADESVPEAALHLLRLAGTAEGSAGSVATNSTGRADDRSGDEDAEGESDDTSIHSTDAFKPLGQFFLDPTNGGISQQGQLETLTWHHNPNQPPLHVQRGGGPASRRPSVGSSTSTRVRQHIPARTQREASVTSTRSYAPSEAPSAASVPPLPSSSQPPPLPPSNNRRTSGRVRKSVIPAVAYGFDSESSEDEGEYNPAAEGEEADLSDSGKGKKKRSGRGLAAAAPSKGKVKAKRPSTSGNSVPAKKARTSGASAAAPVQLPPRKPRRQAYIPPNLQQRIFPPEVEISQDFPRYYRKFPVSAAFPPDSYVVKLPGQFSARVTSESIQQQQQQHQQQQQQQNLLYSPQQQLQQSYEPLLPMPPVGLYDTSAFSPYGTPMGSPLASTSPSSFSFDSSMGLYEHAHGHSYLASPHALPVHHHAAAATQLHHPHALPSPGIPVTHAMSPPRLPTAVSVSTSTTTSTAASPSGTPLSASFPTTSTPSSSAPSISTSISTSAGNNAPLSIPGPPGVSFLQPPEGAKWNKPSDPLNLYWPRFVKGNADDKCGMCPVCAEPKERGGEGEIKWLKLKNSSYVYHMSYAHGLSNNTGLPFSPPTKMRVVATNNKTKDTRPEMTEGMCHKCNQWIPLLSVKNVETIVPELIWWKHAKKCHGSSTITGESDPYVQDATYDLVVERKSQHSANGVAAQQAAAAIR